MKNKFIKSTVILIIGGFINKILAMIIKIFLTRSIEEEGVSLYMLILPTFNLFITLATLSLSTAISKLVSEKGHAKKIILPLIPLSIGYNLALMFLLINSANFIANSLLKEPLAYYPIISISFTLPFIAISSILKGYFYGKENMTPYVISNIIEQLIRLFFIIFIIPKMLRYGIDIAVLGVVLINIISELVSIITLIFFIPNKKIAITDFKYEKNIIKDALNISISSTGSRLIGSISYFLEPIILTLSLSISGYDNNYIVAGYGIISGYVFPLLLIPSFFTMAISTSLLPVIANNHAKGNYRYTKKKLTQACLLSLFIGIFFTITFMLFPKILLKTIYNTVKGENYLKIIAPFFLLHYIQGPLTSYLQGINQASKAMLDTFIGAIIKNILLFVLPLFIGIWGFIIASLTNILYVTLLHIYHTKKIMKINSL